MFFKRDKTSVLSTFSGTAKVNDWKVDIMMNSVSVIHAEIRWAIQLVTSHFSYASCLNMNSLLASMLPDSQLAKSFQFWKTKSAYYKVYSLAPYYKEELLQTSKATPAHSFFFLMKAWITVSKIVCSHHVIYVFQSESTLYICLDVKELLARSKCKIWSLSDCNWTWGHSHLVHKRTLNHLAKWLMIECSFMN